MTQTAPSAGARTFCDGESFPEMVVIPPGQFWMGATSDDDKFASIVEKPQHLVKIEHPFAICRFPITIQQWTTFLQENPSLDFSLIPSPGIPGEGQGGGPDRHLPICNISWNDAQAYTHWLSKKSHRLYRLPTEAEWEYCCRAGSNSVFSTGETISITQANFLYLDFGDTPGLGHSVPVGSYPPNAFGLYDMHGNVCELVADAWHDNYTNAPSDGSIWEAPPKKTWRVVRNGGWDAMPRILRSAFRDWIRRDQRLDNTGFRVACDLSLNPLSQYSGRGLG